MHPQRYLLTLFIKVETKKTEEVNPKAYPFGAGEVPTLAKRTVSRSSSDESLHKEKI